MKPLFALIFACAAGCVSTLPAESTASDPSEPSAPGDTPDDPATVPGVVEPGTPDPIDGPPDAPAGDVEAVNVAPPGPAPAQAAQSCTAWSDCGPHYDDQNSGFECENDVCICDPTGEWAQICGSIGGFFIDEECFCVVGGAAPPSSEPAPPDDAEEDVTCWWTFRDRCAPDEWVDDSYYEYVCVAGVCRYEYVDDGYWRDGECERQWIKRCTDGYEYRGVWQ